MSDLRKGVYGQQPVICQTMFIRTPSRGSIDEALVIVEPLERTSWSEGTIPVGIARCSRSLATIVPYHSTFCWSTTSRGGKPLAGSDMEAVNTGQLHVAPALGRPLR